MLEILVRKLIGVSRVTLLSVTWMLTKLMWAFLVCMLKILFKYLLILIFSCESRCYLCSIFFMQIIVADMRKVLAKNPQVEQQRLHRRVFLENVNPENQSLMVNVYSVSINLFICFIYMAKFSSFSFADIESFL